MRTIHLEFVVYIYVCCLSVWVLKQGYDGGCWEISLLFLTNKRRPPHTDQTLCHTNTCRGSATSLAAGLLFGLLAALGAYRTSQNPRNVLVSFGAAGTLAVVMGLRFLSSGKFMPAGFMTLTSGLMLVKIVFGVLKRSSHST
ncbi:transmembrane protein 14C-like isoform X1 [Oryzias latipes]|uniref:transmembrane protein 14C-like isoform X1 n=1 Tax=Oryzias latipes TaxID=8090 RepID=UPI0009D92E57|nr:transmembrane protein 14C-like isoform X1 [Oryzias latipes]